MRLAAMSRSHRGKYESGGLDQLVDCVVSCPRCKEDARKLVTIRTVNRILRNEIACSICRGALSVKGVK